MPLQALERLRRQGLRRQGRAADPRPPLPRRQHRPRPPSRRRAELVEAHTRVPRGQEGPHRHLRPPRRGRDRRRAPGPAPARRPRAEARPEVPGRNRGPHAQHRPSVHPGDGRFERDLGGPDRQAGRPGHRPDRRHRAGRHGRPVVALHQRLHARPQRQPHRPPQPAGHLHAALQPPDPPGAGQVVHFALEVPRRTDRAPITLEAKVNYRKFDRKYMDYIFGKGKGPELPVVVMANDQVQAADRGWPGR